jgi:hypothetical protein
LCPDCVGHGATGVRCKECLGQTAQARWSATGRHLARGTLIALLVSLGLGLGIGWLGWMGWILGLAFGFVVGSAAFLGSRRHRDPSVQVVAVVAALVGVVAAALAASCFTKAGQATAGTPVSICLRVYAEQAVAAIAGVLIRFRV